MYDTIIVGSGHNGLITAAYLAQAGYKVAVFERRPIVGGAVCTQEDLIPGYKIDVGSSAHIMIHQTPVIKDLELERFGLEYLEMDPWGYYPILGTDEHILFHKDIAQTCQSIAKISPADADAYEKFCQAWGELNEGVFDAFLKPPTPWNLAKSMFGRSLKGSDRYNMIRKLMAPYGQLVEETFSHEAVRTAIIWLAAQSGPPPSEAATGDFAGWHSMYHRSGMKRAKGGSGMLTQALKKRILQDGGDIFEDAEVDRILTNAMGKVSGVELVNGDKYEARSVVVACHIKTTLDQLLRDVELSSRVRESSQTMRIGNGFGMIVRCAMEGLPEYPGFSFDERGVCDAHKGLQLLCPSQEFLQRAYGDYLRKEPPREPVPLVMTFSALDDTLAPAGKHVMFVWGQYHAYELGNGEHWDDIAEREADKLLAQVDRYAPGTSSKVIDRYVQTPLSIERLHGMHRGNVMHLEMSFDQMFVFRPIPELSAYQFKDVQNLFLTGSSTHPGGGVWGASGHNTAQLIMKKCKPRK